ncbi:OmpW/AlkL family protein [Acinetobacter sp. IK40]|jgi:outer membrane protein|uniref:OmpW/AlkL family protein n=1 Tax=Acinetobacter sp. IK40 TaxID=2928897 RepID=UPI002D1E6817|nr:OmpW family outer membrane protein [Acinetobacter sp. IK40]MEB3790506.1 OmpW family protein [Acinetobacter sp. IK40]
MKKTVKIIVIATSLLAFTNMGHAQEFKRYSVSAGWLHVMPQGKANRFNINTNVKNGTVADVGMISGDTILKNVDTAKYAELEKTDPNSFDLTIYNSIIKTKYLDEIIKMNLDGSETPEERDAILKTITGDAQISGIENWQSDAGLEADDIDTLGLMFDYYVNDNVSLKLIGGIPPKVKLKGKGTVYAPFEAIGHPLPNIPGTPDYDPNAPDINVYLKNGLLITDLNKYDKAATATAWTPAIQATYHFGKTGVNKFRPYIGAGLLYAHYSNIKINNGVKNDLIAAGHMIQNIHDGQAGAALEGRPSSGKMIVKVDADDAIAPIVSLGFNYDLNESWFATGSLSYAKLNNQATIKVINQNANSQLIHATTKIDIDPLITYLGVGYRF